MGKNLFKTKYTWEGIRKVDPLEPVLHDIDTVIYELFSLQDTDCLDVVFFYGWNSYEPSYESVKSFGWF